jgi:hypothetical protein
LPNGLEENGLDEVLHIADVGHVLPESVMGRDGCCRGVAYKESLEMEEGVSTGL